MESLNYVPRIAWLINSLIQMICADEFRLAYMTGDSISNLCFYRNGAAPMLAIERASQEGILANNTIKILYKDDQSKNNLSMGYTIEMYEKENVNGFIGIGYSSVLRNTGYLMAHWNVPALSQAATASNLKDKTKYQTLIRLSPTYNKMGDVVSEITTHFGWKRVGIVSKSILICQYSMTAVLSALSNSGVVIPFWIKYEGQLEEQLSTILNAIRTKARIVIFCGPTTDKTVFMIAIQKAKLTTPDYVYIMPTYRVLDRVQIQWTDDSNPDRDLLIEASRSIIQISMFSLDQEKMDQFFRDHVSKMVELWNYNLTAEGQATSAYAMLLHDSTYMYALALNRLLENGDDPRNGSKLVEIARGLTFNGVSGHVAFDKNGDREPTCSLWYVPAGENISRVWAKAILSHPVGKRIEVIDSNIWRTEDGSVPPDTPECGFMKEKCHINDGNNLVLVFVLIGGTITSITAIAITLLIRKRSSHPYLKELLWRVDFSEISFIDRSSLPRQLGSTRQRVGFSSSYMSTANDSALLHSRSNLSNFNPSEKGQMFSKAAIYKGQMVSVKLVESIKIQEREELVMFTELRHENVNLFIGACVQENNVCILTLYCHKGSLQDLLGAEHIQLDNIFKESFVCDLVNGMRYLHASPLKSHGNLKSSNCLIDSRWVLKITDCTPNCVMKKTIDVTGDPELHREKLWTAPELLRAHVQTCRGSPQGDVFAFSIVLQEIVYRAQPYFLGDNQELSPKGNKLSQLKPILKDSMGILQTSLPVRP